MGMIENFDYDIASPEMLKGRKNKLEGASGSPRASDSPSLFFNVSLEDIMKYQSVRLRPFTMSLMSYLL
jgi:hypothetical protein